MSFSSWLRNSTTLCACSARRAQTSPRQRASFRPRPDALEDRCLLSGYQQTNLVGYEAGLAHFTDPNLNGWGMTSMPDGSFVVANAFTTGLATFYDSSGHVLPLTITVPASASPVPDQVLGLGPGGHPTGVVYNPTSDFVISENGKSAPARLIFDTLDGTISGWNPAVDPTHAILLQDSFAAGNPAVYTGLELAQNSKGQNVLYATDFLNNRVDMFGGRFNAIGSFTDPTVTSVDASFGAWSVQAVGDKLYVTFASLKDFDSGVVDVFNTDGTPADAQPFRRQRPRRGPAAKPLGDRPGSGELRRLQQRPADRQRGGGRQHQRFQPGHGRLPRTARPAGRHPDRHHRPVGPGIRRRHAARRQDQPALL